MWKRLCLLIVFSQLISHIQVRFFRVRLLRDARVLDCSSDEYHHCNHYYN